MKPHGQKIGVLILMWRGKNIMTALTPTLITHGGIMIPGGGILIGGEDWASVITTIPTPIIMAVTMGDIMGGSMEDIMVGIMVEEAMAVDIGDR